MAVLNVPKKESRKVMFIVKNTPKAQPRAQFRAVLPAAADILQRLGVLSSSASDFRKWLESATFCRPYGNKSADVYKKEIAIKAREAMRGRPTMKGPLSLSCAMVFGRRKGDTKKTRSNPWWLKDTKPDWDNLEKAVSDAIKGIVWEDDSQVARSECVKLWSHDPKCCAIIVQVEEVHPRDLGRLGSRVRSILSKS